MNNVSNAKESMKKNRRKKKLPVEKKNTTKTCRRQYVKNRKEELK